MWISCVRKLPWALYYPKPYILAGSGLRVHRPGTLYLKEARSRSTKNESHLSAPAPEYIFCCRNLVIVVVVVVVVAVVIVVVAVVGVVVVVVVGEALCKELA